MLEGNSLSGKVMDFVMKADPLHSAREVMQMMTMTNGTGKEATNEELHDAGPQAEKVETDAEVPSDPDAYADGSLLQSKGACWQT